MTTMHPNSVTCAVCGNVQEVFSITSTNQFGSPDLDLRPSEMARSTIYYWVQRCDSCGYCAKNIEDFDSNTLEVIQSEKYLRQLHDPAYGECANTFLCQSTILEYQSQHSKAAQASIHAAWICDDADYIAGAIECRKKALALLDIEEEKGNSDLRNNEEHLARKIDLMRRAELFEDALILIKTRKWRFENPVVRQVIAFEESLCLKEDIGCYTLEDARDYAGREDKC